MDGVRLEPLTFRFVKDFSLYGKDPDGKVNKFLLELYFQGGRVIDTKTYSATFRVVYEWENPEPIHVEGVGLELFTDEEVRSYGQVGSDVGDAPDVPANDGRGAVGRDGGDPGPLPGT
jgi:hypothetical protein